MSRLSPKQIQENEEIKQEFLDYMEKLRVQKLKAKRYVSGVKGWETRRINKLMRLEQDKPKLLEKLGVSDIPGRRDATAVRKELMNLLDQNENIELI